MPAITPYLMDALRKEHFIRIANEACSQRFLSLLDYELLGGDLKDTIIEINRFYGKPVHYLGITQLNINEATLIGKSLAESLMTAALEHIDIIRCLTLTLMASGLIESDI